MLSGAASKTKPARSGENAGAALSETRTIDTEGRARLITGSGSRARASVFPTGGDHT